MKSKEIMKRVYKDGCFDKHDEKERVITWNTPIYTMFKHEPELFDHNYQFYSIVAQYGDGIVSNWLYEDAKQALTCFRLFVGIN